MFEKDIDKEFLFLDAYFKNIKNATVRFISFSSKIDIDKKFEINNANWTTLKKQLLQTKYEGIALYNLLLPRFDSDTNLFFTDGYGVFDKLSLKDKKTTNIISTKVDSNDIILSQESRKTKGEYIKLDRLSIKNGLSLLGINILNNISYVKKKKIKTLNSIQKKGFIYGTVYNSKGVLEGATIKIKNSKKGVVSNTKGDFIIKAKKDDVLIINFLGKKAVTITLKNADPIDVFLYGNENKLDGITIKSTLKKKNEIVSTGFIKKESKKIGFAVKIVTNEELNRGNSPTLSQAVAGKLGGTINGNRDLYNTILRERGTLYGEKRALVVIDGIPMQRPPSNLPGDIRKEFDQLIDPQMIHNIVVLRGVAASNKYGSLVANGVILITTKMALAGKKTKNTFVNKALVKNNDYNENVALISTSNHLKYYPLFKKCKNLDEVYSLYLTKREKNHNNVGFFIEISGYISQWGNKNLATKVLLNTIETNSTNTPILKYIAYRFEEKEDYSNALHIYKLILKLRPKEAQSYRDIAVAYEKAGKPQKALEVYNNILNKRHVSVIFSGVYKSISKEIKNLLSKYENKLNTTNTPSRFVNNTNKTFDARLVFEWNKTETEFELQFVNPQKKFFKWSHTNSENASRIVKEKNQGFYMEEFILDGVGKGEWIINLENKSNKNKTPLVIKYTLYRNYGNKNQTEETKIVMLNSLKGKKMISKIIF